MESNAMLREKDRSWRKIAGVMLLALVAAGILLLGPAGVKAMAQATTEFSVSTSSGDKLKPSANGKVVVWEDYRDGGSHIYGKDLSGAINGGQEFVITPVDGKIKKKPVTNGKFVVWEEVNENNDSDIYGKDLSGGEKFPVADGAGDQRKPSISGNTVVYESRNSDGKWEIYTYDLTSNQKSLVSASNTNNAVDANPTISGDTVVWQAPVTKQKDDGTSVIVSKIFVKNLTTGEESQVNPDGLESQDQPAVSDGIVVWRQESVANYDIFGKDLYAKSLDTGEVFQITTNEKDQVAPAISGAVVVWEDHTNGKAEVHGKNLQTGETFQVVASSDPQTNPSISGKIVVWEKQRLSTSTTDPAQPDPNYGRYDIAGAEVEAPPAAPTGVRATGSLNDVSLKWTANTEPDLAGYNVYRSGSAGGTFTKLNQTPLSATSFSDAEAPKGVVSYYWIEAVDTLGNKSLPGVANAAAIAQSSVSLLASPATLQYGTSTTLSGKLIANGKALSGKQVIIEQKPAGASGFSVISRKTTAADGSFRLGGLKPDKNTHYQARFDSERGLQGSAASKLVQVQAASSSLSLSARPAVLMYGGATVLSGQLLSNGKALSGKQVIIEQKPAGASGFSAITQRTTTSSGSFLIGGLKPKKNTLYRARFVGEQQIQGSAAAQSVKVKAKVSLSKPRVPKVNFNTNITGKVNTTRNGRVIVTIKRNGKVVSRKAVRVKNFRYRSTYKVKQAGKYKVQVTAIKTRANLANTIRKSFSAR